ncbi:Cof-type HAD-IIB family hydrolase [Cohnella sp. CFH 77786]|uniref:HAD family hydrolase n=1 Tax=Cohnella sp. CFH 77786 TaxID=2662265 RepID=UPI001C610472|nr:HAD family hydrolase [Cohnella sp. CFH 77786]MBW5448086.1 Cof-type HAD-IIB family hydrolase [Cohnella sp. CFH 77786]
MKYSAIVLDLDGTLLDSNKQVSGRNYNAVMSSHERGMKIIFASARPPRAVKAFLPESFMKIGSFVYYNGAYLKCDHTGTHHHEPIDSELTAEVLDYCLRLDPDIDLSLEVLDEWMSLKEYDEDTVARVKGKPVVKTLAELLTQTATKILISGPTDVNVLIDRFASRLNIVVTDQGSLIQIHSIEASKEKAVARICESMGIPLDHVMVFGDDFNDIGLFEMCGMPVAMGNAVEELKAISKEIKDTNDRDGVAKTLERMIASGGQH